MDNNESVAHKTVRTSIWTGIEKVFGLGIQFIISMLLARLLSPDDYGSIAMLTVFIAISNQVVACGFVNALIRKIECKSIDYSTAFYFNVVVSLICYVILFLVAPYVASFYDMAILCPILRASSLSIPICALTLVQETILQRELRVKKQTFITLFSSIVSGLLSIVLAYKGFGIWTLVFNQLFGGFLRALLLWYKTSWLPKWEYSIDSMKYLWGFGSKMLLTEFIGVTYANIHSIVIGKFYSGNVLGIFNRGQTVAILLPNVLQGIFVSNSLPIMAQIQNDKERMVHVYAEFIKLTCFFTFPVVILMAVLADPFVRFVLTDKWIGCVIYIQIFSLNAMLSPANSVNLNLLQVYGRSDYTLKAEVIKKAAGFIVVFALLSFGPLILAVGTVFISLFSNIVNLHYAKKLSGLSYWFQVKIMIPVFLCSSMMGVLVYLSILCVDNSLAKLIVGSIIGVVSYSALSYVFKLDTAKKIMAFKRIT